MPRQPRPKRVRISTTIASNTRSVIYQVAKDKALPNQGVTIDYIVNEWGVLKRSALQAAAQVQPQPA